MPFSNDENLLNNINVGSLLDLDNYMKALKPILLEEAGYKEVTDKKTLGFKSVAEAADVLINQGLNRGLTESQVARQMGISVTDFQNIKGIINAANESYRKVKAGEITEEQAEHDRKEFLRQIQSYEIQTPRYEKTDERKLFDERLKALEDFELSQAEEQAGFLKSPEGKAYLENQRRIEAKQKELTLSQLNRATGSINDPMKASARLQKQIQQEWLSFKEEQARRGNVILGDDPLNASARGSVAKDNLELFQSRMQQAIQQENESIISGELPLAFGGVELSTNLTGSSNTLQGPGSYAMNPAYSRAIPGNPGYGSNVGAGVQAQQPFQFQQQMDFSREQLRTSLSEAKKTRRTQLTAALIGGGITLGSQFIPTRMAMVK